MKLLTGMKVVVMVAVCAMAMSLSAASYSLKIEDGILTGYTGKLPASLVIPDGVVEIGSYALESSTLKNVTIPASVKWIGVPAFEGVQNFFVAEGSEYYRAVDGVLFSKDGTTLVAYPDGRSTTSYEIPDGVTQINSYAISGVASLKSLMVPATLAVNGISTWAFDDCKIKTLSVADGGDAGAFLKSVDGVLFSADGTTLVKCPAGKSGAYVIPDDVTNILEGAFNRCELLTSITIPEGVTTIGDFAFEKCKLLPSITLPKSLRVLGSGWNCVFSGCTKLKQVLVPEDCEVEFSDPDGCHKFVGIPSLLIDELDSYYSVGEEFELYIETSEGATVKATGLPSGVTLVSEGGYYISGKLTKAGLFTATITVTKDGVSNTKTILINVGMQQLVLKTTEDSVGMKSLMGAGYYAAGKTAALKATAATGCVFAGWYTDDDGFGSYRECDFGATDYRSASASYQIPDEENWDPGEPITLYAKFVSAAEDAAKLLPYLENDAGDLEPLDGMTVTADGTWERLLKVVSISLPTVKMKGLPKGLTFNAKTLKISGCPSAPGTYPVTVTLSNTSIKNKTAKFTIVVPNITSDKIHGFSGDPVSPYYYKPGVANYVDCDASSLTVTADAGYSLKVSGLPPGLKFNAKTGKIMGTATKSGTYTVTFTATKKGAATETSTRTFVVEALEMGAVGTFNGFLRANEAGEICGTFTLTATSRGKITAKVVNAKGSYSFSGIWDSCEPTESTEGAGVPGALYKSSLRTSKGETLDVALDLLKSWSKPTLTGTFNGSMFVSAYENLLSEKCYLKATLGNDGETWNLTVVESAADATLTLTPKGNGTMTISGKIGVYSVSASSSLLLGEMSEGFLSANFVSFVKVGKVKKALVVKCALDMNRRTFGGDAGTAKIVE